jgi:hypothetical protein
MKLVFYLLAGLLGFLGLMFVAGSQGQVLRIVVGIILFVAACALVYLARMQTPEVKTTVTQQIDLSGDVNLEQMRCQSCGAALSRRSISVNAGAVMVNCEYCGAAYQIEEEVKW